MWETHKKLNHLELELNRFPESYTDNVLHYGWSREGGKRLRVENVYIHLLDTFSGSSTVHPPTDGSNTKNQEIQNTWYKLHSDYTALFLLKYSEMTDFKHDTETVDKIPRSQQVVKVFRDRAQRSGGIVKAVTRAVLEEMTMHPEEDQEYWGERLKAARDTFSGTSTAEQTEIESKFLSSKIKWRYVMGWGQASMHQEPE
jgi:hypothetical protein